MVKNFSRRVLLLLALYLCVIVGIFALQFTRGNAFSLSVGPFMVSAASQEEGAGAARPALPLHVGSFGLDFFLDGQNHLVARRDGGGAVSLDFVDVEPVDGRLELSFSRGVKIRFSYDKRGDIDVVAVSAVLPEGFTRVELPYRLSRSAKIERRDSASLVAVGGKLYSFPGKPLPQGSPSAVRSLAIESSAPVVYYQTWLPAKGLSLEQFASLPGATESAWERAVEKFAASALVVFRDRVASGVFSEQVAAAYVAEMGRIGMYRGAIEGIPESFKADPGRTWLTSTFFNDLERKWAGFMTREREERTTLAKRLADGNPAAFEFPSLVTYLVDRGSSVLLDDLIRVAGSVEIASTSPLQSAGLLECLLDMRRLDPSRARAFEVLAESCERTIASALVRVGDSLFVSRDGKNVDTAASLRIASILIRYGSEMPDRAQWRAVGYLVATSLLSRSGASATLPVSFTNGPDGVSPASDALLGPSSLYPLALSTTSWYPRAKSLATGAGSGIWAWTSAVDVVATRPSADSLKLSVRFPQGETHYMVVRGIKAFSRIKIYGMDFRTDPRFESYNSSGYRYDPESGTLFLKMRHKVEIEDVVIHYGIPAPEPAAAADEPNAAAAPVEAAPPVAE